MLDNNVVNSIRTVAKNYRIEPELLMALVSVESSGTPFWKIDGKDKPVVRFEGHYFYKRLNAVERSRAVKEGLASPKVGGVANPVNGAARYVLIDRAAMINHDAAYESVSWGLGQIMGANWSSLGYSSVQDLVDNSYTLDGQIDMIVRYIETNNLIEPLKKKQWKIVAKGYNGSGYAKGAYDVKLEKAYKSYSIKGANTVDVDKAEIIQLQTMLNALGSYGLVIDGIVGTSTNTAIRDFQLKHGLVSDGIYGPLTKEAIEKAYVTKNKEGQGIFGAGAASIGVLGTALSEAAKQIQPLVNMSKTIQIVFVGLVVIGAAITGWSLLRKKT